MEENIDKLAIHIETMEGIRMLLEDVLEDFTAASMSVDSKQRHYEARAKLSTLITLMGYTLKDLNDEQQNISDSNRGKK
ncbi:hypothetical protein CSV61_16040 [Sporosarcina sp. P3]|uniref:hypothetical protein n=1 Tax=Sporosarcina sp. P3 TaxID=2048245 RepID=UPI000C169238|nr:hypothetical protein [Sporosarcina sp. P3]PID20159.1 hypothetical protein CSV61_16040 [Sporosarcina sp. P3]